MMQTTDVNGQASGCESVKRACRRLPIVVVLVCAHVFLVRDSAGAAQSVAAWGRNDYGQLNVPQGQMNVVAIAAGYYYSLALEADGTVVAWGDNWSGQLNVPV